LEATYVIHAEEGYVEEVFSGSVTYPELMAFLGTILADPQWHNGLNGLADFSNAIIAIDYESMHSIVSSFETNPNFSRGRWAFVVDAPLNFGMTRMFQSLTEGIHTVRLFPNRAAGLAWLLSDRQD